MRVQSSTVQGRRQRGWGRQALPPQQDPHRKGEGGKSPPPKLLQSLSSCPFPGEPLGQAQGPGREARPLRALIKTYKIIPI